MDQKKQKEKFLEELGKAEDLSDSYKEKCREYIKAMDEEEFECFAESFWGIHERDELREEIASARRAQMIGHNEFKQTIEDFLV